ncbi:penicillin-binding protein 3 [Neisseria meningitidis]|nr:penicillin-binding protein 3 [Neisseria meningitidis]
MSAPLQVMAGRQTDGGVVIINSGRAVSLLPDLDNFVANNIISGGDGLAGCETDVQRTPSLKQENIVD